MVTLNCPECDEPILPGETTSAMHIVLDVASRTVTSMPAHVECLLRPVMSHYLQQCTCYVPGRSLREEARATQQAMHAFAVKQWN